MVCLRCPAVMNSHALVAAWRPLAGSRWIAGQARAQVFRGVFEAPMGHSADLDQCTWTR